MRSSVSASTGPTTTSSASFSRRAGFRRSPGSRGKGHSTARSTIPAFTPTAWSSFLTGLNPAGHGIFAFTSNPNRGGGARERREPCRRAALALPGAAGIRSAFVTVPFTHPPEPLSGVLVTGSGDRDGRRSSPLAPETRFSRPTPTCARRAIPPTPQDFRPRQPRSGPTSRRSQTSASSPSARARPRSSSASTS